jgi:hypothetical protein
MKLGRLAILGMLAVSGRAHADALRCDAYYQNVQYYITSTAVSADALEAVWVDQDFLDIDDVQTCKFGTSKVETSASGESVAYLGYDSRGLSLSLVFPAAAPLHKGGIFKASLRVTYGLGTSVDAPANCQVL